MRNKNSSGILKYFLGKNVSGLNNHLLVSLLLFFQVCAIVFITVMLALPVFKTISPGFVLPTFLREIKFDLIEIKNPASISVDEVVSAYLTGTALQQGNYFQTPTHGEEKFSTELPGSKEIQVTKAPSLTFSIVITSTESPPEILCSPIEGVQINELSSIISQEYNVENPYSDFGHHGVDFGSYNFQGKYLFDIPIQAIFPGIVAGIVKNRPPLGNTVILETTYDELSSIIRKSIDIQPGQSIYHLYGHLLEIPQLNLGTQVLCGESLNRLGDSQTVEAHLHLELRIGLSGHTFGSMTFYDTSATEDEMAEYLWWRTSGDFMPLDPMDIFSIIASE